jgi:hypothetical protein
LNQRNWDLTNLNAAVTFDPDQRLVFEQVSTLPTGWRASLITDDNEPRLILARMGSSGPILDSTRVSGFDFWGGGTTLLKVLQTYSDGSQLVEMLLVMNPVPPDITVQVQVAVGGVVFEDGTVSKTIAATDFDSLGRYSVRFIRPASAQTSVCHSIKLLQGTAVVGEIR